MDLETGFIRADEIEAGIIDDADGELAAMTDAVVAMLSVPLVHIDTNIDRLDATPSRIDVDPNNDGDSATASQE